MSCLSWNRRGLGNPATVRELHSVVKQERARLVFVMETKNLAKRVESLQRQLGFAGCFTVDSVGLSGGIGLFWSADVVVDLKNYSSGHIDVMVQKKDQNSMEWRFTGFYGAPRVEDRHHSWRFLRTLYAVEHSAWLCLGDCNETLFASEHFSRAARPEWQMRAFWEVTDDCLLQHLGWSGAEYTWDNGQAGDANLEARLDRAFGNMDLIHMFAQTRVRHISTTESDHCFVMVDLRECVADERTRGAKQFRYEDVWQTHADYDQLVMDRW